MSPDKHSDLSVAPAILRKSCDSLSLRFERSDELPEMTALLGQQRAIDAISFGIQMQNDGYNVVVLGNPGSHRHELVNELVRQQAVQEGPPHDWCYVNNFANPERPQALHFEAGEGAIFRDAMYRLIEEMKLAIPAAFEGDDYRSQLRAIEERTEEEVAEQWRSLEEMASKHDIHVLQTPTGYVLAPVADGKVLDDKDFEKLPEGRQQEIQQSMQQLSEELQKRIEMMPKLRKQHRERVKSLDRQVMEHSVSTLLLEVKTHYDTMPHVLSYLNAVELDIIENAQNFRQTEAPSLPFLSADHADVLRRYEVNLIVDNKERGQAPVIYEPNPNYPNLIGRVDHRAEMGALVTDFRMIRGGALHQANGGYLVLDLHRLLGRPFSWDALKQALLAKQVRIESPGEAYGWVSTTMLKPEAIPLDIKIVLVGERWLYYMLCLYDNEFSGLFKVAADFDDDVRRDPETVDDYARLIAQHVYDKKLLPFTRAAMQRVIEQQARHADDGEKLSMDMRALDDLLLQSDYWARQRQAGTVDVDDVTTATDKHRRRFDRLQTNIIDAITRDTLLIDTSGACVGQVNGLSIIDLGQFRYGHPVRITATTRIGTGEVVDIEREVELGGKIHSKGMLILSSALTSRFAPEVPLSLHGSVVFEQSYGGVEGDSASVAEMCVLLSSLSRVPLKQGIAVTGSVNQLGRVQAVGGINEKIEGFFEVCRERGLDGSHGVIIPRDNLKHLMLRDDVVQAVRDGQFSIYSVINVDEAVSLLTGMEAGMRNDSGEFPEGSVNARVEEQLIHYANLRKTFAEPARKGDGNDDGK